jgi:hypothetical protein
MKNLLYLQEGLLKEDHSIVSAYISELDIRTGNAELIKAGEQFGFKTVEAYGKIYAWSAEIARVHGYARPEYVSRILDKWEIQAPSIGWFPRNWGTRIRETLGLNEKDSRAILIDWTGFLIIGVKGEGENADAVLAYLLQREREARINTATVDQVKAEEHAMRKELHRIKMLKEKITLCKVAGITAPPSISEDFFQVTGIHLPKAAQAKLFKGE